MPEALTEDVLINPDDVPEDMLDGFTHPPEALAQCAICRRTCVRDHFVWNERRLCAWDYHATVFGKRGPWRDGVYEEHHFATLPKAEYVAGPLLAELGVDPILAIDGLDDALARRIIDAVMAGEPRPRAHRGPHPRRLHAAARAGARAHRRPAPAEGDAP